MRRVVVTGLGVVSPCGRNAEETWTNVVQGRSGIAHIQGFDAKDYPSQIAGECKGFVAEDWIEKKRVREGDRFIHLAVAASQMAMDHSGLKVTDQNAERIGVFMGVGMCGLDYLQRTSDIIRDRGPRKISPYFIPAVITNLAPGQVSMRFGLKGPSYTTTSACSSSAHSLGEAFRWIQRGDIDAAVTGGSEAAVSPLGVGGFTAMRALSTRNDAPEKACRPFDRDRDGFIISEGAGMLILEELEFAKQRGANILGEVVGYGATTDAYHLTSPAPRGEGARRAMRNALQDAKADLTEVDYLNAHATSTGLGDIAEAQAISDHFGEHATKHLWVSSTKSMTGHLLGAAGGLESAFCIMAIRDGIVPPTINLDNLDPECPALDFVPHEARKRKIRLALSNSFGFGGTNVSLAFRAFG